MNWLTSVALNYEGDECLPFPFATRDGYGFINDNGSVRTTNNFICEKAHGPAPTDQRYEAAHSCGNRPCCNKRHLRWATCKENSEDKHQHGTYLTGEAIGRLTDAQCLDMISMRSAGARLNTIAEKHGTDARTVSRIVKGESRSYLQEMARASPAAA